MRRTTICRSKAAIAFAFAITGLAVPAFAQQNPPSPQQQQPAAQPARTDSMAATPLSQLPATHIVDRGETLWSLARQYFGDPLLWPEIYRLNTDVVEDPHWIFPGEELRITQQAPTQVALAPQPPSDTSKAAAVPEAVTVTPQADSTKAAAPAPAAAPVYAEGPTIFSARARPSIVQQNTAIEINAQRAYRAIRAGEVYSSAFLTEGRELPTGRVLGTVQSPNITRLSTTTTAQLYSDVAFTPPPGDSLKPGDLLLSLSRTRPVREWGQVVKPTGLLRVVGVSDSGGTHRAIARVERLFRQLNDGQEVLPVLPVGPGSGNEHAAEVENGITGHVIGLVDVHDIVGVQDMLFIDRGAQDSIQLGDIFQISGTDNTRAQFAGEVLPQAEAMVVNVQQKSCTVKIISIQRPDVRAGSTAQLIRRMPS